MNFGEVRVAPIKKIMTETCLGVRWSWCPSRLLGALVEWKKRIQWKIIRLKTVARP